MAFVRDHVRAENRIGLRCWDAAALRRDEARELVVQHPQLLTVVSPATRCCYLCYGNCRNGCCLRCWIVATGAASIAQSETVHVPDVVVTDDVVGVNLRLHVDIASPFARGRGRCTLFDAAQAAMEPSAKRPTNPCNVPVSLSRPPCSSHFSFLPDKSH